MNFGIKTMEDPLGGKHYCGKCKLSLWGIPENRVVRYILMDGRVSSQTVNVFLGTQT